VISYGPNEREGRDKIPRIHRKSSGIEVASENRFCAKAGVVGR
jgi:hypothetical protein